MFNYNQADNDGIEYFEIGLAELLSGERLFVEICGIQIVVFNIAEKYFAISDVCTHDDGPLGDGLLDEYHIVCPRHGAEFDVRNGKALTMPAVRDIPAYPIKLVDGIIFVGIPLKNVVN